MFIEASYPRVENEKARLISPEYTVGAGGSCVQFYYHMWGQGTGALNVLLKEGDTTQGVPLWSLKGDQDNQWRSARATVQTAGKFQVVFEGVIGSNYEGDISIDDISVSPAPCPSYGSCSFEQDFCTWTTSTNSNDFTWYRLSPYQLAQIYTGANYPTADTTTQSVYGHFLWTASNFRSNLGNQSSTIYSEVLLAYKYQQGACLSFNYALTGPTTLNIYARERPIGKNTTLLWTTQEGQGNQWNRTEIDITIIADDVEVRE